MKLHLLVTVIYDKQTTYGWQNSSKRYTAMQPLQLMPWLHVK